MSSGNIRISVSDQIQSAFDALKKTTAAAFAGAGRFVSPLRGKRKSAQVTFKIRSAKTKRSIESEGRRQILGQIFAARAVEVEIAIKRALQQVIEGITEVKNTNVTIFGRSLGTARPQKSLDNEPFAKFIKSRSGAGEIGLPDPNESLRQLKNALLQCITVDVVVRKDGPQVKFLFNQRNLLKLTPHPDRFEGGSNAPFFSWLSLVTGPDFTRGGTPGFSLVRASDLKLMLRKAGPSKSSRQSSGRNMRRANIVEGLIRASRTRGNAGEFAAIMMSNRAKRGGKSPSEAFGGQTKDYKPNPQFNGYWDEYWMRTKIDLITWSRRVISSSIRGLLRG